MELPFEQGRRRRIYLMRHAQAAYFDAKGARMPEPHAVPLTPKGREEALAMADWLAPVRFDRAICSGLPRTLETATLVLGGREIWLGMRREPLPSRKLAAGVHCARGAVCPLSQRAHFALFRVGAGHHGDAQADVRAGLRELYKIIKDQRVVRAGEKPVLFRGE